MFFKQAILLVVFVARINGYIDAPDLPFRNVSLSWEERVDDLVSRLTLEEIQEQLAKGTGGAPAIPRLGIEPWEWWTECLNGDVNNNATAFPSLIGMGATFAPDLIGAVAHAIGIEVRAKYTKFSSEGKYKVYQGLSCLSPMLNIMRDPRWGRCEETFGEDPYLSGISSKHVVLGLQGDHPRYLLTSSGCKSFDAYAGPETNRLAFDAVISTRDLRTTFLPAFKTCVQSGTYNVMCSYNSINGIPSCANKELITDILRNEWGFKGYVISDAGAIEHIISGHKYINNSVDTVAACIKAGCNLELGPSDPPLVYESMVEAVRQGKLQESLVREMSKPLWYTRMRLGDFDPPEMNPYTQIPISVVQSESNRDLAELAAMQSFVLLKNNNNFLPVNDSTKFWRIAIVGPLADNPSAQISNYSPLVDLRYTSTPLDNLSSLANQAEYAAGCNDGTVCLSYDKERIISAVRFADFVVVCLGLGNRIEMEARDRTSITLPRGQLQLLKDAVRYTPENVPILLILFNAGPVDLRWADQENKIVSIIEAFYPAQATGNALYHVITNRKPYGLANPAARLPFTWPSSDDDLQPIANYSMDGRTYRYLNTQPLYPFGYGLSYTKFTYSKLDYPKTISAGTDLDGTCVLQNTGHYYGDEVMQVYISWLNSPVVTPKITLVDFNRISSIAKNETRDCFFTVKAESMAVWREDDTGWQVYPGRYRLSVGGQQPGQIRKANSNVLIGEFTVTGTKFLGKY
ncbi:hypothetical protein SNE40_014822 [Patella caerulea]|uniref:Fibronectin type III-like domain-containing protein n=1 Tax=Patella caerulea TaxID=87958 RepID=A0AAN8JGF9_PATCE